MIISKTPFRISFVGGGSDHFNKNSEVPGRVICTTINKYMYISINKKHDNKVRLSYSVTENVKNIKELDHLIIKKTLDYFKIYNGIEIVTIADIPSSGSGLGSSSALTVGLVKALKKFKKQETSKKILSEIASKIEIEKCKKPIGMQDHYAAAYGGFNSITFNQNKNVTVNKIDISKQRMHNFKRNLIMFYSGINRKADKILGSIKKVKKQNLHYKKLSELSKNFEYELTKGNLYNTASILHESWMLKKGLHKTVSSLDLDSIYENALNAGALGGKLLGAGGGGYFLFFAKPELHKNIKKKLHKFQCIDFDFSDEGSTNYTV
jgi:D-glycero-alpha-D-manno-heptose-7-phosphate kinase